MTARNVRTLLRVSSALSCFLYGGIAVAQVDTSRSGDAEDAREAFGNSNDVIMVTATRQSERLDKVPASISAFSQESIETQGMKDIQDLSRFAPNLQFSQGSNAASASGSAISIRGIASGTGASTTGIYINDTPIQVRRNGFTSRNSFPTLFDLERVEVLRGPQGTLFGSGSQGGAVRFITSEPNLDDPSAYVRGEISTTDHGGINHEVGAAAGVPLVTDRLGVRLSAYARQESGYIDHVDYFTKEITNEDSNSRESLALSAALTWTPTEWLSLTPSILYNRFRFNDIDTYWLESSDASEGIFQNENIAQTPNRQHFTLSALQASADLGAVRLISNTSYFDREEEADSDFTQLDIAVSGFPPGVDYPEEPGVAHTSFQRDTQKVFTQEVRIQNSNPDDRFTYTVGLFFSSAKQQDNQRQLTGSLERLFIKYYGLNFEELFGVPSFEGLYSYVNEVGTHEKQYAAFGQVDFKLTPKLEATVGARYSRNDLEYTELVAGPYAFPGGLTVGNLKENSFTPKFGLSFQADPDNLFYTTAAKGFRPGGVQVQPPAIACRSDLEALGLTDPPTSYESDSVWSYEVGAKNSLFGGQVRLDTSLYYIKWSDIQQAVPLRSCAVSFTTNLGSATSKGIDFIASADVTDEFSVGVALAYTDARFDEDVRSGRALVVAEDQRIVSIPFSGSAYGQMDFDLFGNDSFARVDYLFNGGGTDPERTVQSYNPLLPNLPATHLVNFRLGVETGSVMVSAFMNNVLDAAPETVSAFSRRTRLLYGSTVRPRTTGVTVSYRY